VRDWDVHEYNKLVEMIKFRRMITIGGARRQLDEDGAATVFAYELNKRSGVMLCTGFSLFKACQVLELTVGQQTLVQLMLFIQDGLDELMKMPPAEAENKVEEGEMLIRINGKSYHMPVETSETDLARDNHE
jgi:hypothetical protein